MAAIKSATQNSFKCMDCQINLTDYEVEFTRDKDTNEIKLVCNSCKLKKIK